jgi:hypothetical protein
MQMYSLILIGLLGGIYSIYVYLGFDNVSVETPPVDSQKSSVHLDEGEVYKAHFLPSNRTFELCLASNASLRIRLDPLVG